MSVLRHNDGKPASRSNRAALSVLAGTAVMTPPLSTIALPTAENQRVTRVARALAAAALVARP
jgi:hypothetical protein